MLNHTATKRQNLDINWAHLLSELVLNSARARLPDSFVPLIPLVAEILQWQVSLSASPTKLWISWGRGPYPHGFLSSCHSAWLTVGVRYRLSKWVNDLSTLRQHFRQKLFCWIWVKGREAEGSCLPRTLHQVRIPSEAPTLSDPIAQRWWN